MSMLKVAGSNANNAPKSLRTDDDGKLIVRHEWVVEEIPLVNALQIRDTVDHWSDRLDLSKYATVSLRIYNSHDKPVSIIFGRDYSTESTGYLKNYGGATLGFTIPASSGSRMVTPEEFPFLQYLHGIKLRSACSTAPTNGGLYITVVGKY